MSLFRKKKKKLQFDEINQAYKDDFENRICTGFVLLQGKRVYPIFNDVVQRNIVKGIGRIKSTKVNPRWMCMRHSDIAVYYSLQEGAKQQGIEFEYSIDELFLLLNWEDYANILNVASKTLTTKNVPMN